MYTPVDLFVGLHGQVCITFPCCHPSLCPASFSGLPPPPRSSSSVHPLPGAALAAVVFCLYLWSLDETADLPCVFYLPSDDQENALFGGIFSHIFSFLPISEPATGPKIVKGLSIIVCLTVTCEPTVNLLNSENHI